MPPKTHSGAGGPPQQQAGPQGPHGGMPAQHNQHYFHQYDPNVDGQAPMGGAGGPQRPQQYQQPPHSPPNAGGSGKRGGGGNQPLPPPQGHGGGHPDYVPYGGGAYYGGNEYGNGPQPPQSGNSSPNPSATRRSTGAPGGNNGNNGGGGGYGPPNHNQRHFNNQQSMPPMQPPPQQGGGHYGGAPMGPGVGNNSGYGMDQGPNYNAQHAGARDGGGHYGDAAGVASPNPPSGGGYMPGPPNSSQGPRRGGNYGGNSGMMNAPPGQPLPPASQSPQQQRYSGGGNNMYRSSPYPAPGTPHHPQQPPSQPSHSMPPPQQPQGGGGNNGGGGWQPPSGPGMLPPPPPQGPQHHQQHQMPPQMGPQMPPAGGNYGYNNNMPHHPLQQQQMVPQQNMYHGAPAEMGGYPGGGGGGYEPHQNPAVPYGGGPPYPGANTANYGPSYDGPAPGMPSVVSPPPGVDPSAGMMGGGALPPPMNMRGVPASMPPQPAPQAAPGYVQPGMVSGPGGQRTSMPPQDYRGTPMVAGAMAGRVSQPPIEDPLERQKDLYTFLSERRLLKKQTLSRFFPDGYDAKRRGPLSIAVDGNYLLSNLRSRMCRSVDPLWFLHSSLPDCLTALVHAEVQQMREQNLEPVWVFQGIGISGDVEAFLPSYEELRKRDEVWQTLMEGAFPQPSDIVDAFDTSTAMGEDVIMAVQRFLRSELNVLTVTAPFSHWCQMCTLHHEGDVQLLYGHPEMLMVPYGSMKLIVEIDFTDGMVAYFDREEVLRNLFPAYVVGEDSTSASDRLLDLALLVATQPVVTAARASTKCSIDTIYQELSSTTPSYNTLTEFINANEENQSEDRRGSEALKHSKGRAYMQYSAVFTKQSKESPLTYFCRVLDPVLDDRHTPSNLSGVFGNLLPLSLFFFQYAGLLSVSFMTIITQSYFRDELPVSDSLDYQECLPKLVALRGQIVFQIVLKLRNEAYQQRLERLSWVRWFEKILLVVQRPISTITLDEWKLEGPKAVTSVATRNAKGKSRAGAATEEEEGPENVTVATVLNTSGTCIPAHEVGREILYRGRNQTMQAILLKSLDFLGYFSHKPQSGAEEDGPEMENGVLYGANGSPLPQDEGATDSEAEVAVDPTEGNHFTQYLCLSLSVCDAEFQSALVRFTELLRVQVLNAAPSRYVAVPADEGNGDFDAIRNVEVDEAPVRLASRIACLVTVPYLEESTTVMPDEDCRVMKLEDDYLFKWSPVYSRSLCAFSIMVRAMNRDLRELVEVITASLYLQGHSDCSLEEFTSFIPLLPFGDVPSSIGGLLLHYVLVFPDNYDDDSNTIEARCELLHTRFSAVRDITTQLRRVMEFTFQALFLLNAYIAFDDEQLRSEDLTSDLVDETLNLLAHKWQLHLSDPIPVDVHQLWPRQ